MTTFSIEKRAVELFPHEHMQALKGADCMMVRDRAVQLARETAEAIATKIEAAGCDASGGNSFTDGRHAGLFDARTIARSFARPPAPETREQRLEKALRTIADGLLTREVQATGCHTAAGAAREIARRALEEADAR